MVVHGPGKMVDVVFRGERPMGKEVPLAIVDNGDHASLGQDILALLSRRQPARRLLVCQGAFAVGCFDRALACPHLAAGQSETGSAVRIDGDHRVQERAVSIAFGDLAQPAAPSGVVEKLISLVSWIAST